MKLPMLYARAESGKVLEWEIEIEGPTYRTITGQQGGQKVTSAWTTCQGKNTGRANATTPEQQALKDAQAQWKKKNKSGGYWENQADIDQRKFIEPMLANKLKDRIGKLDFSAGLIVQLKFNGIRCVASKDGLFSRKGERFISVPHIEQDLKMFFEANPYAVLDGELFNAEYRQQLNEIVKLCRKTVNITEEDLNRSRALIQYYIYDGYGFNFNQQTETTPYCTRKAWIDQALPKFSKYYRPVKDYSITTADELDVIYRQFLSDGHEGAIIRIPISTYEHRRSNNLLKYKPLSDAEFKIISVVEGDGNWSGKARVITLQHGAGTFNADFKGTMEEAEEMLKNKQDYVGKIARIFFFGYTGLGVPNYAKFDYNNWRL